MRTKPNIEEGINLENQRATDMKPQYRQGKGDGPTNFNGAIAFYREPRHSSRRPASGEKERGFAVIMRPPRHLDSQIPRFQPLPMPRFLLSLIPVLLTFGAAAAVGQTTNDATLTWSVGVPEGTPADTELFMAGNVSALGPWQPNAFRMKRSDSGRFTAQLTLPKGTELEYKFTRGSWGGVEKSPDGEEIPNRRWRVEADAVIEVEIAAWAKSSAPRVNTGTGDLRWRNFPSRVLQSDRRITVWLPPQYHASDSMRFPVVYLLDGQNVFDAARAAYGKEWRADETALQLAQSFDTAILVAIDNSPERMNEYTPVPHSMNDRQVGGKADDYLRFLCEELKPWIDHQFPTRTEPEHTTLVGSSLGGLLVLHALSTRGDIVGNGVAMSPSLFWGESAVVKHANSWSPPPNAVSPSRLWIDMGTLEGKSEGGRKQLVDSAKELESILRTRGGESLQVHLVIAEGAEHNEDAWAKRLPDALRFAVFGEWNSP